MDKAVGYKPYDKDLHREVAWTENRLQKQIQINGCSIIRNPDKYGIDFYVMKDNVILGGIEVELHGKYWKETFPFQTVHFLGRKAKCIEKHCFYIMVNEDYSDALMIPFTQLEKFKTDKIETTYTTKEPIFDIPLECCTWGWLNIIAELNLYFKNEINKLRDIAVYW